MPPLSIEREKTCCFSGYRPHKFPFEFAANNEEYQALESGVLNAILKSYNEGYNVFLCGGAKGFDLLCGELCLTLKKRFTDIKLICVLPFKNQAQSFSREWQLRYSYVLEHCDVINYISEDYYPGCFFKRNEKMVDYSSRVITYHNGRSGGTARTLAYAQLNKLEIINVCREDVMPEQITFFTGVADDEE